jgi:hypothetical protein
MIAHVSGFPIEEALPAVVTAAAPILARISFAIRRRAGS